jgi:hypothetical protein
MSDSTIRAEDVLRVRSRVSWSAVLAGAVVALSLYFLLTLVGSALGLPVVGNIHPSMVGMGAVVWAILSTVAALFVGGWVTSQLMEGESKVEAALHGVILWGVLFGLLLWLMAGGIKAGFNPMVGLAQFGGTLTQDKSAQDWEAAARRAGVSQETIDKGRREAGDAQQDAAEATTGVTWWVVLGTLLSMVAAVVGALVGVGPTFRLREIEAVYSRMPLRRHQPADQPEPRAQGGE